MLYSLTLRMYKKLLSNSKREFKNLILQGDRFSRNKRTDENVKAVINQNFCLKEKVTDLQVKK